MRPRRRQVHRLALKRVMAGRNYLRAGRIEYVAVGLTKEQWARLQGKRSRTFTGTFPDGVPICVTVHDAEGVADLAIKDDGRWGAPIELVEEES